MSIERDLLNEVLEYFDPLGLNTEHCGDLPERIKELLAQPEQEQEPVAWCQMVEGKVQDLLTSFEMKDWLYDKSWIPLYLAPQTHKPITGIEISNGFKADDEATHPYSYWAGVEFAEKHHGIGVEL